MGRGKVQIARAGRLKPRLAVGGALDDARLHRGVEAAEGLGRQGGHQAGQAVEVMGGGRVADAGQRRGLAQGQALDAVALQQEEPGGDKAVAEGKVIHAPLSQGGLTVSSAGRMLA